MDAAQSWISNLPPDAKARLVQIMVAYAQAKIQQQQDIEQRIAIIRKAFGVE